jgi:thioredoxin 1
MVDQLTDAEFEAKTAKGFAVIDFYADWCGPCQAIKPIFEKTSKEFTKVHFFKVNVDDNEESAAKFEVRSIPTIVFLKDGELVNRIVGTTYEDAFKKLIKETFKI